MTIFLLGSEKTCRVLIIIKHHHCKWCSKSFSFAFFCSTRWKNTIKSHVSLHASTSSCTYGAENEKWQQENLALKSRNKTRENQKRQWNKNRNEDATETHKFRRCQCTKSTIFVRHLLFITQSIWVSREILEFIIFNFVSSCIFHFVFSFESPYFMAFLFFFYIIVLSYIIITL